MNTFPKHLLHFPKHPKKIWRFDDASRPCLRRLRPCCCWSTIWRCPWRCKRSGLVQQLHMVRHLSTETCRMPMRGRCWCVEIEIWIAKPGMSSTWKILPRPRISCCGTPDSGGHSGAGRCHRSNSVWQPSHPFGLRSQYVTVLHSAFEYCVLCVFTLYTFYNLQHLVSVVCELGSLFSKQNKQSPRWQLLQFFPSFSSLAAGITKVHFFLGNSAFKVVRDGRNRNRRGEIVVKWVKVSWLQILWRRAGSAQDSSKKRSFEFFHVTLRYLRPSD